MRHNTAFLILLCALILIPGATNARSGTNATNMLNRISPKKTKKKVRRSKRRRGPKTRARVPKKTLFRRRIAEDKKNVTVGQGFNKMGTEIKDFGAQMIMRIDRLIKKKSFNFLGDPWTIQGIPLLFWTRHRGYHLGVHIMMNNIRRQDPHKAQLRGQVLASDQGQLKHFLMMDFPRAFKGNFRIRTRIALDRDLTQRFFGRSNETQVNSDQVKNNDVLFQNIRHQPNVTIEILKRFGKNLQIGPVFGLKWSTITAPPGSLLAQTQDRGIEGGRTHYFGLAIIDDRTDFEPYPSRGSAHELFLTFYNKVIGSDYNFFRGTYNFRKYWPLHRTLTLAHRTFFESINGDVPYYELGATGGLNRTHGFGGSRFLRGYFENQFIGNLKFAQGWELRWDPLVFNFARQVFTIGFVPFFDIGRVWNTDKPLKFGPWHASTGWGLRAIWNHRFIIRADVALTNNGSNLYVELGNSF